MPVTFRVLLHGDPLRRVYVSHFDFNRIPNRLFFRTDEDGKVRVTNINHPDLLSSILTQEPNGGILVRVHAQNLVVRVLDGDVLGTPEVVQEFSVHDGGTINIDTNAVRQDHFRIVDLCRDAYEHVFKMFPPFNKPGRGNFPFGRVRSIQGHVINCIELMWCIRIKLHSYH
jgi:hypothetical protein